MEKRGEEGVKESIGEDTGDCTMGKAKEGRKGRTEVAEQRTMKKKNRCRSENFP